MNKIDAIIVHCSATKAGNHPDAPAKRIQHHRVQLRHPAGRYGGSRTFAHNRRGALQQQRIQRRVI